MKKPNKEKVSKGLLNKKKVIFVAASVVTFLIAGLIVFNMMRTYPLGDDGQVVYLGKEGRGEFGPLSSSYPYHVYFYGTDMTPEELATYLKATIGHVTGQSSGSPSYDFQLRAGESISIQFYKEKSSTYIAPPYWARATSKRYFFYILEDDYSILKNNSQ